MKIKIFGGLLVAALAITSIANAQAPVPHIKHINRVERKEDHRIAMDVRKGKITRGQAFHLRNEERRLNEDKRMAMADGRITRGERRHLRREEKRLNRTIRRDERTDRAS
jgi:hypothetical protein